jgi:hypothetical protein
MSPSRSRKPVPTLASRRAALNRAAHAQAELTATQIQFQNNFTRYLHQFGTVLPEEQLHALRKLTRKIAKLSREYYKLVRRAANIRNANLKSGPLNAQEWTRLRREVANVKNMSVAARTTREWGLPFNLQNRVARTMARATG